MPYYRKENNPWDKLKVDWATKLYELYNQVEENMFEENAWAVGKVNNQNELEEFFMDI